MTLLNLPQVNRGRTPRERTPRQPGDAASVLLIGNPNSGKTTLFNALTGLRAKTANYPGVTVDHRAARVRFADQPVDLVDLPGLYSLDALTPEERLAEAALQGDMDGVRPADLIVLVLDATNLERHLFLAGQVMEKGLPMVAALSLMDAAHARGIRVDVEALRKELGCPVVPVSARKGEGLGELRDAIVTASALDAPAVDPRAPEDCGCLLGCGSCPYSGRYEWAEGVAHRCGAGAAEATEDRTWAIDKVLTHPIGGLAAFFSVMAAMFYLIFSLAGVPMDLIEQGFGWVGGVASQFLPAGDLRSLIVDGVIGGVGGVIVFLPQICILFFFITLLEDSGYLARAAFVMERLMRFVGLPGRAFVPMLTAHACAIPGIMATRVIEDRRDRLVTILVTPLLTCSARLPVYAMIAALLFGDNPGQAALMFLGAYVLGIAAALGTAFLLKGTILKGDASPLVIELPAYRRPSLRSATMTTFDRAAIFVKKAGTTILVISIVLWALATYPKLPAAQIAAAEAAGATEAQIAQQELAYSAAGRMGQALEPVFAPLGFDWRINVGVVSSFAAREVLVSTMAIMYGVGEGGEEDTGGLVSSLREQKRDDGTPLFTPATGLSLLVFFVLAMQCLPTQVITKRETGSWGWALLQLGYMTALAWGAAFVTYQAASRLM